MTETISNLVKLAFAGAAVLLMASSAGCATQPDIQAPPVSRGAAVYPTPADDIARTPDTLTAAHFDGPDLNDAGMTLLDGMLHSSPARPLIVHLAVPTDGDATAESRRAAVASFLRGEGLSESQFELRPVNQSTSRAD